MSIYSYIPQLSLFSDKAREMGAMVAPSLLVFAVGLYLTGPLLFTLLQHHRRNHLCQLGLTVVALSQLPIFIYQSSLPWMLHWALIFIIGMGYGLAQMMILSTLVIDKSESFQRTEANYIITWGSRLSLSLGPLLGIFLVQWHGAAWLPLLSAFLSMASCLLIATIRFPFKAPEEPRCLFSTDRFFLVRGWPLFLSLMAFGTVAGLMLYGSQSPRFFLFVLLGLLTALVAEKFALANAELKSEAVIGSILLISSALLRITRQDDLSVHSAAVMLGLGIGLLASRHLLFFIKLSHHCERGTSQSTFFLSWETGLVVGLSSAILLPAPWQRATAALVIVVCTLSAYIFFIHPWYLHNKNR